MSTTINFHGVKQIKIKADCAFSCGQLSSWQTLVLMDADHQELAEITLFLTDMSSAIPHGDFRHWLRKADGSDFVQLAVAGNGADAGADTCIGEH